MNTTRNLMVLSLVLGLALAATACGREDCHDITDENGNVTSVCGCQDTLDEKGDGSTYCEDIGSTQQGIAIVCGVGRGFVTDPDNCSCYAVTPHGLIYLSSGISCFVK
jgi:hypothetical protein